MLHLLDSGFAGTEKVVDGPGGEVVPVETKNGKIIVGKFPKKALKLQKWFSNDLGVIYMIRDPRDVLVSSHYLRPHKYWVKPDRWIGTAEYALEVCDREDVELVRYEDLILKPNEIQKKIGDRFNLEIIRPFADCYAYFDESDTPNISAMRGARPLDPKRIGNWKDDPQKTKYANCILQNEKIKELMGKFHYY